MTNPLMTRVVASLNEATYGVWLGECRVGVLHQRGDYTWFEFSDDYRGDPDRPVLGLKFEDDLQRRHASHLRLPWWFSNLLPEGILRDWIAEERGVSHDREMELLAQVGHDLPGAVRVLPEDTVLAEIPVDDVGDRPPANGSGQGGWRFSLAGVGLKFSMLAQNDRLTMPAHGEGGDWIVKLPDRLYAEVPRNEFAMMSLAAAVGIDVPEIRLMHRDEIQGLPANIWPAKEEWAFAIRRFDRDDRRGAIHIEDFAQVRGFRPEDKYHGSYETVAALIYRRRDLSALREFARRLAFDVLISNGDAHLKNWSLIYPDRRVPTLAPAYDLVATQFYAESGVPEQLGLRFGRTRRFDRVTIGSFARLQNKLQAHQAELPDIVAELVRHTVEQWPRFADQLVALPPLAESVTTSIAERSRTLLRSPVA